MDFINLFAGRPKGVVLSTLLGVGTQSTFGSQQSNLVQAIQQSAQENINRAGQRIVDKKSRYPADNYDPSRLATPRRGSQRPCSPALSKLTRTSMLKLSKLPDRTPIKIAFRASPELAQMFNGYCTIYRESYHQPDETVEQLIPFMLSTFMESDPQFKKARNAEKRSRRCPQIRDLGPPRSKRDP